MPRSSAAVGCAGATFDIEKTFMTDLALHSIGIILFRLEKYELFTSFMEDMIINGMEILSSSPEDLMK